MFSDRPFKYPFSDTVKETYDQKHDVRKLSDIFTCLHGKRLTVCSDHLVKSMGDDNDKYVPPSDTILLHPFFWSTEKTCDFLFTAGDFYIENSTFDNQSCLSIAAGTQSQAKSNREALETFIKVGSLYTYFDLRQYIKASCSPYICKNISYDNIGLENHLKVYFRHIVF